MMLTSLGFKQKPMAAPAVNLTADLTDFELQITEMKRDGYTHNEILSKEQEQGVRVSLSTLERQLRAWGPFSSSPYQSRTQRRASGPSELAIPPHPPLRYPDC